MLLFYVGVLLWSFLEASLWWVAPDIGIGIAYVYFPKYWRRFLLIALLGAFLGCTVTYYWARIAPDIWLQYVSSMRFHSQKNIQYVRGILHTPSYGIVLGAWNGIPYKLFFGLAPSESITFISLAITGLISRALRFSFVLSITSMIRKLSRPWSDDHPTQLCALLLAIWAISIFMFDVVINQFIS